MTPKQISLYFREWAKTRAHLKAHPEQVSTPKLDDMRHHLHVKALGHDKNHTAFTNSEFDRVLGVFRAVYDGGNLNAQLRQIDMPDQRREDLIARCWDACRVFIHGLDQSHKDMLCERYMEGVASKVCGKNFCDLDERELGKVFGVLDRQARRVEEKQRREHAEKNAAADRAAQDADQPF